MRYLLTKPSKGACASQGTAFVNSLTECEPRICCHCQRSSRPSWIAVWRRPDDGRRADQVHGLGDKGGEGGKYGKLEKDNIAAAGQSCSGLEALSVSGDPRVKLTAMFNSGLFGGSSESPQLKKLKHLIGYFLGGTGDIAYQNVSRGCHHDELYFDHHREKEITKIFQPTFLQ
jgi:hypothetical protein